MYHHDLSIGHRTQKNILPKDRVAPPQHFGSIKGYPILHHQCIHLPLAIFQRRFFFGEAKVEAKRRALEVGPRKPSRFRNSLGSILLQQFLECVMIQA